MFLKENFLLALAGLMANKMRALLTMLGIIIGIGSVIAIVSVGNSLTASVTSEMSNMGASNILVFIREKGAESFGPNGQGNPGRTVSGTSAATPDEQDLLSMDQIEAFQLAFEGRIADVGLSQSAGNAKAQDGRLYANVSVMGVNQGYRTTSNINLYRRSLHHR